MVAFDGTARPDALLARHPDALAVRTKADLPGRSLPPVDAIAVSALHGSGVGRLRQAIRSSLGCDDTVTPFARCWTAAQRAMLRTWLDGGPPPHSFI